MISEYGLVGWLPQVVVPVIDRHYPLRGVPEVIRCLEERQAGKIVITV